jgi:hypothetical protein
MSVCLAHMEASCRTTVPTILIQPANSVHTGTSNQFLKNVGKQQQKEIKCSLEYEVLAQHLDADPDSDVTFIFHLKSNTVIVPTTLLSN